MSTCNHQWQTMYEESILGGFTEKIGYQCKTCNEFISQHTLSIAGLPGTDTGEKVLVGPHGSRSKTSKGEIYSKQIIYPDGRLEIIP